MTTFASLRVNANRHPSPPPQPGDLPNEFATFHTFAIYYRADVSEMSSVLTRVVTTWDFQTGMLPAETPRCVTLIESLVRPTVGLRVQDSHWREELLRVVVGAFDAEDAVDDVAGSVEVDA